MKSRLITLFEREGIRDPTIFTGGLTTSLTGMHCDIAVLDDVVVRKMRILKRVVKVRSQYSASRVYRSSRRTRWVVGTRYHPLDLYNDLMEMRADIYDIDGSVTESGGL